MDISLVFPHQLFLPHPALAKGRTVYLVEEFLFFRQYRFHKQKLVLHRASMKAYAAALEKKGFRVMYVNAQDKGADIRQLVSEMATEKITGIHCCDSTDHWLEKRLQTTAAAHGIRITRYTNPNFLNDPESLHAYFNNKKTYFQTDFYIAQRKQRALLLDRSGKPAGGKWSFDAENREKIPKGMRIPEPVFPVQSSYVADAIAYIEQNFPGHYGEASPFRYPVTHEEADRWLDQFLVSRFMDFGRYEDAMRKEETWLFHSVLTPMLNIGLLDPAAIIQKATDAAEQNGIPLPSLEGFIRQLTGWREFIRAVYVREGSDQRTRNYWGFTRKIPGTFWCGQTGIHPVDTVIRRLLKTGYSHHIERLMVLGNFMLLCEFDPNEVYRWFMEMYVDSYDWVMVPNVYGMTQFADGGLMTTKPYISGSNYLMKMGNWDKGPWQKTWDGLFWRFMHVHRDFFLSNPRLGMLVRSFDKMPEEKKQDHLRHANEFLEKLGS